MSTYIDVYLDGHFIYGIRNPLDLGFLGLFTASDVRVATRDKTERRHLHHIEGGETAEVPELVASTEMIRDRLRVLGFAADAGATVFERLVEERIAWLSGWASQNPDREDLRAHVDQEIEALTMSYADWQMKLRVGLNSRPPGSPDSSEDLPGDVFGVWADVDPMVVLSAIVETVPPGELLLDMDEYVAEWDEDPSRLRETTLEVLRFAGPGSPPIVITEGRTDAEVLQAAVDVLFPHLDGYIRFFDFDVAVEGGAPALGRLLKSFAAAAVANRVLAVFDNDTAGTEQVEDLASLKLPTNYGVTQLPRLGLAESYPTLGPSGPADLDVNGLAGSIELYLGEDVLRQSDGDLAPVQWTGFNQKIGRYQGAIVNKKGLLRSFRAKAERARVDQGSVRDQDWSGLLLVMRHILHELGALADPAGTAPDNASTAGEG